MVLSFMSLCCATNNSKLELPHAAQTDILKYPSIGGISKYLLPLPSIVVWAYHLITFGLYPLILLLSITKNPNPSILPRVRKLSFT